MLILFAGILGFGYVRSNDSNIGPPPNVQRLTFQSLSDAQDVQGCGTIGEGRDGVAWTMVDSKSGAPYVVSASVLSAFDKEAEAKGMKQRADSEGGTYSLVRETKSWREVQQVIISAGGHIDRLEYVERVK